MSVCEVGGRRTGEFDDYLQQVRRRASDHVDEDAARELRAHFDAAVTEHLASGLTADQAEAAALAALGRPEDVAAAFRREGRARVRRLAGGPWAVVGDARREWPLVLMALGGALLATQAVGMLTPQVYEVRQPLAVHVRQDYGTWLRLEQAVARLRDEQGLPVAMGGPTGVQVVATSDSYQAAATSASTDAKQVQAALPPELPVEACYLVDGPTPKRGPTMRRLRQ